MLDSIFGRQKAHSNLQSLDRGLVGLGFGGGRGLADDGVGEDFTVHRSREFEHFLTVRVGEGGDTIFVLHCAISTGHVVFAVSVEGDVRCEVELSFIPHKAVGDGEGLEMLHRELQVVRLLPSILEDGGLAFGGFFALGRLGRKVGAAFLVLGSRSYAGGRGSYAGGRGDTIEEIASDFREVLGERLVLLGIELHAEYDIMVAILEHFVASIGDFCTLGRNSGSIVAAGEVAVTDRHGCLTVEVRNTNH